MAPGRAHLESHGSHCPGFSRCPSAEWTVTNCAWSRGGAVTGPAGATDDRFRVWRPHSPPCYESRPVPRQFVAESADFHPSGVCRPRQIGFSHFAAVRTHRSKTREGDRQCLEFASGDPVNAAPVTGRRWRDGLPRSSSWQCRSLPLVLLRCFRTAPK